MVFLEQTAARQFPIRNWIHGLGGVRLPTSLHPARSFASRRFSDLRDGSEGIEVVGAVRFELTTSCTRNKRASQATLRPDAEGRENALAAHECK